MGPHLDLATPDVRDCVDVDEAFSTPRTHNNRRGGALLTLWIEVGH